MSKFASGICLGLIIINHIYSINVLILTSSGLLLVGLLLKNRVLLGIFLVGFVFSILGCNYKSSLIPKYWENQKILITGQIKESYENKIILKITDLNFDHNWQLPAKILLNFKDYKFKPGAKVKLLTKLHRPHNYANPGSFDFEKYCFQHGIHAVGYIPQKTKIEFITSGQNKISDRIIQKIKKLGISTNSQNFIGGLLLGKKNILGVKDNNLINLMQQTGVIHLLAVSGLHLGLLAGLVYFIAGLLWRVLPVFCSRPFLQITLTIMVTAGYMALTGFSPPTVRAWLMLVTLSAGIYGYQYISLTQAWTLAFILGFCLQPLATLSASFWLSYVAIGLIIYLTAWRYPRSNQVVTLQVGIFFGLLPITVFYFEQISLNAIIANLIAIPIVSFGILPFVFIGYFCNHFWNLAAFLIDYLIKILELFNNFGPQSLTLAPTITSFALSGFGVLLLLAPKGFPGKYLGVLGFVPLFWPINLAPLYGQFEYTMLDAGQGLASVIRTNKNIIVFDTGPNANVIAPYLKSQNIKKINNLIISHTDSDHVGGFEGLQGVQKIYTSNPSYFKFPIIEQCQAGQNWRLDGVDFEFLHPGKNIKITKKSKNNNSCVLKVSSGQSALLLTGDISRTIEQQIISNYPNLRVQALQVPHHGSNSASSVEFIQNLRPDYALIAAGYLNQYKHPRQPVLDRYHKYGVSTYCTADLGALKLEFHPKGMVKFKNYRSSHRHFWQDY